MIWLDTVVYGFLVYMAVVVDSNNNFHGVLLDSGNGKVQKLEFRRLSWN
jgi:hypothetical protein